MLIFGLCFVLYFLRVPDTSGQRNNAPKARVLNDFKRNLPKQPMEAENIARLLWGKLYSEFDIDNTTYS